MVEIKISAGVSLILRTGVIFSAILMLIGLALYQITGDNSCPTGIIDINWIIFGDPFFSPSHVLFIGFLVLLSTPVVRIIYSIVSFSIKKDYIYSIITSIVLLVLLISFSLGIMN